MNVLALIANLEVGGAQTLLPHFAKVSPRAGIRLSVAYLGGPDSTAVATRLRAADICPVNLDIPRRMGVSALRRVGRHIASVEPDILHTHLGPADALGCTAARLLDVPAVSTIHAMDWNGPDTRERARLALMARARKHGAARIIAVSESARHTYLAQGWDVSDRLVTVYNGIDASPKPGSGIAVRRELGFESDDFVIGMVSPLRPEKGHDLAIEAIRLLRSRMPRVRLLIAGEGAAAVAVGRLAQPLGEAVVLTGARSDTMALLDSLDILLQPSRADALPTTIIEAMAASVPVVASAVGGIPEIIEDNHTAVLVPAPPSAYAIADAISALLDDPTRRRQLAAAARRRYEERFTAGPWVSRTRAVYEAVLLERGSASTSRRRRDVPRVLRSATRAVATSFFALGDEAQSMATTHPVDNDVSCRFDDDRPAGRDHADSAPRSASASRVG